MKTVKTGSAEKAAGIIRKGGIVAFPTETVYGLGASVFDEKGIIKIFIAKERPSDNPLIVHIADTDHLQLVAGSIPISAQKLIDAFFPGPLTVILPKAERVPEIVTAGLKTVGVRMPDHPLTSKFLKLCGTPVVAPSANRSGRPSPTTWQAVESDLGGRIDCILKGSRTKIGLESTVVDCTGKVPVILRAGALSLEKLRKAVPSVRLLRSGPGTKVKSPGMKHRHYAPEAKIVIISQHDKPAGPGNSAYIGLTPPKYAHGFKLRKICKSPDDYARFLFDFFRKCDKIKIDTIYCQPVPEKGIGLALMDRIKRGAMK